jgi:hypothetical protein
MDVEHLEPSEVEDSVEQNQAPATYFHPAVPEEANGSVVPDTTLAEGQGAEDEVVPPGKEGLAYVPLVEGQVDCTRCRTVRVLLHQTGN